MLSFASLSGKTLKQMPVVSGLEPQGRSPSISLTNGSPSTLVPGLGRLSQRTCSRCGESRLVSRLA